MRLTTLFLIAAFAASTVDAASYQKIDGRIVDPIQSVAGGNLPYTGNNLESYADLRDASLSHAYLPFAILWSANLSGADVTGSDLRRALHPKTATWANSYYYTDNLPDWHSDMDQAWRDSVGILAIDPASGDFNGDGVFDAADYTVWQDNGGDQIDYRTWKDNFGQPIASGSGAEPTTLLLALLALTAVPLRVRHG